MDKIMQQVVSLYETTGSLNETAKHLHVSVDTVRKMLISAGAYETARTRKIGELYQSGKSVREIAAALDLTENCVSANLPYTRSSYLIPSETVNAQRIRECRARKKA